MTDGSTAASSLDREAATSGSGLSAWAMAKQAWADCGLGDPVKPCSWISPSTAKASGLSQEAAS